MIDHKEKIGLWLIKETFSFFIFQKHFSDRDWNILTPPVGCNNCELSSFLTKCQPCVQWLIQGPRILIPCSLSIYHIFINTVQVICWNFVNRVWLGLKHVLKSQWQCSQWTDYLSSNFNSCSEEKARAVTVLWPSTWIIYLWCCPSTCTAHCIAFAS